VPVKIPPRANVRTNSRVAERFGRWLNLHGRSLPRPTLKALPWTIVEAGRLVGRTDLVDACDTAKKHRPPVRKIKPLAALPWKIPKPAFRFLGHRTACYFCQSAPSA